MKKILYLITIILGALFISCNPMSDINDEVDALFEKDDATALFLKDRQVAPAEYTLTDEDYELSSNADVSKYHNFSNNALPKDFLPEILNQKFSGEDAQSMLVTYDFYERPYQDKENARVIEDGEYAEMGQSYPNFDNEDEAEVLIGKLLDRKVYAEDAGAEMTVKYTFFSRNETRYIRVNADGSSEVLSWSSEAVEVTDEIYEATGNGKFKNFYKIDNALNDLAQYATENGLAPIVYSAKVFLNYLDEYVVFIFDGTNWTAKQSVTAISEELNYSLDEDDITKSFWWADPAIKITLTGADYDVLEGSGDNGGTSQYGNFDLRSGKIPGTDTAKLAELIGVILDTNYETVEGQQYLVSYAYYDGSSGVGTIRIIKQNETWSEYSE